MDLHLVHRSQNGKEMAVMAFQFEVSHSCTRPVSRPCLAQVSAEYNPALAPVTDQADYLVQLGSTSSPQTGFRYFSVCGCYINIYIYILLAH